MLSKERALAYLIVVFRPHVCMKARHCDCWKIQVTRKLSGFERKYIAQMHLGKVCTQTCPFFLYNFSQTHPENKKTKY